MARDRLTPLGVEVRFAPGPELPATDRSADTVLNRHGRLNPAEVARVLHPGGNLLTQQVGSDDCREINEALGAPEPYDTTWTAETASAQPAAAGLTVLEVREEWPAFTFHDVGALVHQLRAVPWQIPDFTVAGYEEPLRRVDARIRATGEFRVRAHRFVIRARVA